MALHHADIWMQAAVSKTCPAGGLYCRQPATAAGSFCILTSVMIEIRAQRFTADLHDPGFHVSGAWGTGRNGEERQRLAC